MALSTSPYVDQKSFFLVTLVTAAIIGAALAIDSYFAPFRAEAARQVEAEIAAESRSFCDKHASAQSDCVAELQAVRDAQTKRVHQEHLIGVY